MAKNNEKDLNTPSPNASPILSNRDVPSLQDMLFAERMIYKEVYTIMAQNHVNDRANLYIKVTRSLWLGESSLQTAYDRQIAKAKQEKVWNAILHNPVILSIQGSRARIFQEVTDLLQSHHIDDEGDLYKRVSESLMNGEGAQAILEQEISQDELDEIRPQLNAISALGLPSRANSSYSPTSPPFSPPSFLQQSMLLSPPSPSTPTRPPLPSPNLIPRTPPQLAPQDPQLVPALAVTFAPAQPPAKAAGRPQIPRIVLPDTFHPLIRARTPSPQASPQANTTPRLASSRSSPQLNVDTYSRTHTHSAPPGLHSGILAPFASSASSPRGAFSLEWIPVFRLHSLLRKFHHSDFNKIEEWATQVQSTSQIAKQLASQFRDISAFNKKLYPALFFHIKRQLDLGPFVESLLESLMELEADVVVECEQYSIRMLINLLLSNCDLFLRQKLIQLISTSNPIPLTEFVLEGDSFSHQFIPEPCSVLEDKFIFFSFGIGKCKGKSTVLNKIFGTTFETSKDSQFFSGTIDCQGDRMFVPSRGVVVVDGHGEVSIPFKLGLFQLADGIIMQVQNDTWNSDPVMVRHEIEMAVQYGVKFVVVLVRDAVESQKGRRVLDSFLSMDLLTHLGKFRKLDGKKDRPLMFAFKLPSLASDSMAEFYVRRIREKIMECLWTTYGLQSPSGKDYPPGEYQFFIKTKKADLYQGLLSEHDKASIEHTRNEIADLMAAITLAIKNNKVNDTSFFKVYPKFKAMRRLWSSLVKAQFNSTEETHKMRVQLSELSEEIKRIDLSDVGSAISKFEAMVTAPNSMTMVFTFVQTLKKVVAEEIEVINAEALILKSDIQANPLLLKSTAEVLQDLSETMENKSLSIEVFWREINQLFLLGRDSDKVCEAFVNFLKHGEPFEIIDGDNLYFPYQFLSHSLKNSFVKGKRILLIGVIGPQNSGKSTLLNFMFGCNFAASDGRTTKGVYGSIMESPVDEYDFLLILDTEGLHSIEKSDPEYDRKVVLFTLAVCDVVIANVRDQISDGMSKTIEICAKALTSLHNAKMPQPILFFVQNQRAYENIPHQAMADVIANLTQDGISDTLKLGFDNFIAIPSAFNTKGIDVNVNADEKWQKLELLPKFVERVAAFTSTVFSKIKQRQNDFVSQRINKPFHDLPTWLEFAHNIFITVNKFDDLTRFGDILEEKQDQVLRKWLQKVVDIVVSAGRKDNLICLPNAVSAIDSYFHDETAKNEKALAEFVGANHIKSTVHKSHLQHLKLIMETERANWTVDAKIRIENERLKLDASNGQRRINEKIREIVRVSRKYNRSQLASLFDDCFKASYDELVNYKQHIEQSIKSLCLSIVSIYKLYCTDLPNSEEVKQQLAPYQDPEVALQQILANLKETKYADLTYSIPSRPHDFIDNRILSSSEWVFVDHNVIALLKAGVMGYLADHPTATDLDDRVLAEIFGGRPLSERMLITLSKWLNNAKGFLVSNNSHEQTPTKWAVLLVRAFNSALPRNPELIAKLVTVELPFAMVKSKALEMQLQERLPSAEVIHRCVAFVNDDVIAPCDADLLAFGLALTQSVRASLHILMLQYVVAAHLNYHKKKLEETLANFQDQTLRNNWQANFIEQTLRGPNRDSTAVEMLVEKFEQKNMQYCLEGARKVFADTLARLDKTSTRFRLQLKFERHLFTKSQDELLAYVRNPHKFFTQQFEAEWKQEEVLMLEDARMIYQREGNSVLSLAKWAAEVQAQIASAKFSSANDIFLAPSGFDAVQVLQKKEKALVLLFCDLLQGRTRTKGYNIDGLQLDIAEGNIPLPAVPTPTYKLDMLVELVSLVDTISDLHVFASRLSARLLATGNLLRRHQCFTLQLDPENLLQSAREKAAGCNQLCPCCMRCCDEEHWRLLTPVGMGTNRHKCRLGHQYRGMAGFSYEKTKFASLKICGNMQDTELIWFQDRFVLWNEFKSKFPSWDFHFPVHLENETIEEFASRIARIWHDVGKELCTEYQSLIALPSLLSILPLSPFTHISSYA